MYLLVRVVYQGIAVVVVKTMIPFWLVFGMTMVPQISTSIYYYYHPYYLNLPSVHPCRNIQYVTVVLRSYIGTYMATWSIVYGKYSIVYTVYYWGTKDRLYVIKVVIFLRVESKNRTLSNKFSLIAYRLYYINNLRTIL